MRKKLLMKSAACVCAGVLAVSSLSAVNVLQTSAYENMAATDITAANVIGTYDTVSENDYAYQGYHGCDVDSTYKYLKITYKGDADALAGMRWEFRNASDEALGFFWFSQNAQGTLLTTEGEVVPAATEEEQTVIIDLVASGVDLSDGISAFHSHANGNTGKIVISDAAFMQSLGEVETTGSLDVETTGTAVTAEDIILNGDENGQSSLIGKYKGPTLKGEPTDAYKYMGFATLKDATSAHKYLIMTFSGNITQLRFQFANVVDGSETAITEPYWFNAEGQTLFFATPDDSVIPLEGEKKAVVIDLAKTGIDLGNYNSVHMHCDLMATYGNYEIINARLSASPEVFESDYVTPVVENPTEPATNAPTTVAPTTVAPTTVAPTTVAPTTVAPTTKPATKVAKAKIASAKKSGKKIKLTIKKVANAKKYEVKYGTDKKFKKATKTVKTTKVKVTLKKIAKKVYYIKVRAIAADGTTGAWSKVKKVKK
ncbi:MAG: hypothetical protein K6G88_14290 [Lachnospiraceae bacterium]|nr:hypothetical protein [Lachnospiraceae bacterium]